MLAGEFRSPPENFIEPGTFQNQRYPTMSDLESIDVARYRKEITSDIDHLLNKYCRILGWEIPEVDDQKARKLIIQTLKDALAQVESDN
jgi:hypothetical protein